jgi:hypothetical protein
VEDPEVVLGLSDVDVLRLEMELREMKRLLSGLDKLEEVDLVIPSRELRGLAMDFADGLGKVISAVKELEAVAVKFLSMCLEEEPEDDARAEA